MTATTVYTINPSVILGLPGLTACGLRSGLTLGDDSTKQVALSLLSDLSR